jgi:hypothetical protein
MAERQIRSLVLSVNLVGSRPIWPAHVDSLVDLVGSRPVPSDRLDDQRDDQALAGRAANKVTNNARGLTLGAEVATVSV